MIYNKSEADSELVRTGGRNMGYVEKKRWLFLGLPWTFTKYTVEDEILTIDTGFLKKEENDCYMYRIQDVVLSESLAERIFGLGTVSCLTSDKTHPRLELIHIKNAKEVKNFILEKSEEARLRRRTVGMQNLDADEIDPDIQAND